MKFKEYIKMPVLFSVLSLVFLVTGCFEDNTGNSVPVTAPPGIPSGVTATDGDYRDKVVITWTEAQGAETYKILKSIDNEDDFRPIVEEIAGNSYDDTTASMSRYYYYKVVAVNAGGEGGASESDLGYTNPKLPAKITGLTASGDQPAKVVLTWDPADNVTHYKIFRSSTLDGEYLEMADNHTDTSYTDEPVSEYATFFYRVAGVNIDGTGEWSDPAEGFAQCLPPEAPLNLLASDGTYSNKVTVSWEPVSNAVSYTLYRCDTIDGTYTSVAAGIVTLTYEDLISADTAYYYAVAAVNPGGESGLSLPDPGNTDSAGLNVVIAPGGVAATDDEYDQVTVTWDSVAGATGYKIFRSDTSEGTYTEIADVAVTNHSDTTMNYLQTVYYKVKAYNGDGDSEFSFCDSGYSLRTLPGDPSITSTTVNDTSNPGITTITWSASTLADTYTLYRSTVFDGTYSVIADNFTATTFNDTTAEPAVEYYYRVVAINAGGESTLSAPEMGVAAHPGPDNMATADTGSFSISLSWDTVQDATSYQIYRAQTDMFTPAAPSDLSLYSLDTTITHDPIAPNYTYEETGLTWWVNFHYRIRVVKNGYTGAMSDPVTEYSD